MNILLVQRVHVEDDILVREIEDEAVILNLNSEKYFFIDDVGTRMWQLITSSETIGDAYNKMLDEYDVQPEVLEKDLISFVDKLEERELIRIESAES